MSFSVLVATGAGAFASGLTVGAFALTPKVGPWRPGRAAQVPPDAAHVVAIGVAPQEIPVVVVRKLDNDCQTPQISLETLEAIQAPNVPERRNSR